MKPLRASWAVLAAIVFVFILLTIPRPSVSQESSRGSMLEHVRSTSQALLLNATKTVSGIKTQYTAQEKPVRILIIPGHHNDSPGASAYGVREADLNANIGERIATILSQDKRLHVTLSRDIKGFREPFASFLTEHAEEISAFRESIRREFAQLVLDGRIQMPSYVPPHGDANLADALKLYGANLWAYQNDVDIVIHLHLNDYAGRKGAGKYSGYAIYYAGYPLANTQVSGALANSIATQIEKLRAPSDFPSEIGGLIPDPELIAVGAHGSVDASAVLIEYGYITERVFSRPETRDTMADAVALATARGVLDFLESKTVLAPPKSLSTSLTRLPSSSSPSANALAFQHELARLGLYPPAGKTLADCPLTGTVGPCTKAAHQAYIKNTARARATVGF